MPASFHRDLPTVEQRLDAEALRRFLYEGTGPAVGSLPALPAAQQQTVRRRPSSQLWDAVTQAATIAYRVGTNGTALASLDPSTCDQLVRGQAALVELTVREQSALDDLQAAPPAYLVAAIGRPPPSTADEAGSDAWRRVAARVEAYRAQYHIADPTRALGTTPAELTQLADRSATFLEILWSPNGLATAIGDPRELGVFDGTTQLDVRQALGLLNDPAWRHTPLPQRRHDQVAAAASPTLRAQAARALGLLDQRPPGRSLELERLQANRDVLSSVMGQGHDHRPAAPAQVSGGGHGPITDRLTQLDASIAQAQRAQQRRLEWDRRHSGTIATGLASARELARREVEALLALQHDPPGYLRAELGPPPADQAGRDAWCRGARLIERHRTRHDIADPDSALGPKPADPVARAHRRQVARQLEAVHQELPALDLDDHAHLGREAPAVPEIGPG